MRVPVLFVSLYLMSLLPNFTWADHIPEVSQVYAAQRVDGSGLVDVIFDLFDADQDEMSVRVFLSEDGGATFPIECLSTDPSPGSKFSSGENRHIVWNAVLDFSGNEFDCVVRVVADDGSRGVDGIWGEDEWYPPTDLVASNTFPGWSEYGNVKGLLVTWDASDLYIGLKGNSWGNATLIYIDSSDITTNQENADYFQGFESQSFFDPDFVGGHYNMEWGDGIIPTDIRSISAVDGTTSSIFGPAAIAVHDQNHDGGLGEGFTEIAIPWALIGLEPHGSVRIATGVGWASLIGPVVPAGGLGGYSGDELGGADQEGGTDGDTGTLDGPVTVFYDSDGDGQPD